MRANQTHVPKDVRALIKPYIEAGAVILGGRRHAKLRLPNNRTQTLPGSPSDHRALANLTCQLRRLAAM